MTNPPNLEFADLLASNQERIYRYVVSLLGDAESAWDVLQETNRVLLEKRDEFEIGTSFVNWALTVAQFQTMAWLRDKKRSRIIVTAEIVEQMADDAAQLDAEDDSREEALKVCLERLSDRHRQLFHLRYVRCEKLSELSSRTGRTANALKQMFFRLRRTMASCIEQELESS